MLAVTQGLEVTGERIGSVAEARPVLDFPAGRATWNTVQAIHQAVSGIGGRVVIVGGAVRDAVARVQGRDVAATKDLDLEVFGVSADDLRGILERVGPVETTGAAFEVFKVGVDGEDVPLDVALPRRERSVGARHTDFTVTSDPGMTFEEAARRRDFTIGAMGFDLTTGTLLDPHGGAADLRAGLLRHVSPAFDEDPLRVLRAARFAARTGFTVHPETLDRCRRLRPEAEHLPKERLWSELSGVLLQGQRPGYGLHVLNELSWIDVFPEIAALRGVPQDPQWHPEGDVFQHTAHVLDFWGANLRTGEEVDDLIVAVAAMCHDFGKPATTAWQDNRWRAHGHEEAGLAPTQTLLHRLGQVHLAREVLPLVVNHLAPVSLHAHDASDRAVRRLSSRVSRLDLLARVSVADVGGRPPLSPDRGYAAQEWLLGVANRLGVTRQPAPRIARGHHLASLGIAPGPVYGELLRLAHEAELDGDIQTEADAQTFLRQAAHDKGILNKVNVSARNRSPEAYKRGAAGHGGL